MKFTKQEIRNLKRLCDAVSKVKDKVSLRPGEWFYIYADSYDTKGYGYEKVFKFINYDDRGSIIAEGYGVNFDRSNKTYSMKKEGKFIYGSGASKNIITFGSGKEAIDWIKKQIAVKSSNINKH